MRTRDAARIRAGIVQAKSDIAYTMKMGFPPPVSLRWDDPPHPLTSEAHMRTIRIRNEVLKAFERTSQKVSEAARIFDLPDPTKEVRGG